MRLRERTSRPDKDTLRGVGYEIARRTAAMPDGSLRLDWRPLDDGEAAELVDLVEQDEALTRRQIARYEELLEQATGKPGLFAKLRNIESIAAMAREAKRSVVRRSFSTTETNGLLGEIAIHLRDGMLRSDHVLLLVAILSSLELGEGLAPHARVEEGPVLIVHRSYGPLGADRDPEMRMSLWREALDHLALNQWVVLGGAGNEIRIELGVRSKQVMAAATKRAAA